MWARVILPCRLLAARKHLYVMEDAVDILPLAPAVLAPLDVPDRVVSHPPSVVGRDVADDVGVVPPTGVHSAEDDVPNANIGGLLL